MDPEPVPPAINVTERLRALGLIPPDLMDPDDAPIETVPDYETNAIAEWKVERMGRKIANRLRFLRWLSRTHPEQLQ